MRDAHAAPERELHPRSAESSAPVGIQAHGLAWVGRQPAGHSPHASVHPLGSGLAHCQYLCRRCWRPADRGSRHHRFDCSVAMATLGTDSGHCGPLHEPGGLPSLRDRQACDGGTRSNALGSFSAGRLDHQHRTLGFLVSPKHSRLPALSVAVVTVLLLDLRPLSLFG